MLGANRQRWGFTKLLAAALGVAFLVSMTVYVARYGETGGVTVSSEFESQSSARTDSRIAITHWNQESGNGGVSIIESGGDPEEVFGEVGVSYKEVVWVDNGKRLAYTAVPVGDTRASLFVGSADGSGSELIASGTSGSITGIVPSPGGSRIAFSRATGTGGSDVFIINTDGTSETELSGLDEVRIEPDFACSELGSVSFTTVDWTQDGRELVLEASATCGEVQFTDAVFLDLAGEHGPEMPTTPQDNVDDVGWSPSRQELVYETRLGLVVQDRSGGPVRSVGSGIAPVWSQSGKLAFIRSSDPEDISSYNLWVASEADSKSATPLVDPDAKPHALHWSPDGSQIAFIGLSGNGAQLWTVSADGNDLDRRTPPELGNVLDFDYDGTGVN